MNYFNHSYSIIVFGVTNLILITIFISLNYTQSDLTLDISNAILGHSIKAHAQSLNESFISGFNTGSYPIGISVNPFTDKIYVANQFSNTVSVFDSITNKLLQNVDVGAFPYGMDNNLYNNRIYVTNRGSDEVSVIDGLSGLLINTIKVGQSPVQISVNPSNNWVYVTNLDSNSITIIDGITNRVDKTIEGVSTPYGIDVNPVTNKIYVTNIANSTVTVIDEESYQVIKNINVGQSPVGIDIDVEKNLVFVTNYLSDSLTIINGTDDYVIKTLPVGKSPVGVELNPLTNKIYISNIGSHSISVIDEITLEKIKDISINPSLVGEKQEYPFSVSSDINFPLVASFIGIDPIQNILYATNTGSNTITTIDGEIDETIVKVSFQTRPENAGFIECNGMLNKNQNISSISTKSTMNCSAIPERGYYFSSWSGLNSSEENPVQFSPDEYGQLIATFRPTLGFEAYVFMAAGITGASSVIIGYFFKGRQRRQFNKLVEITNKAIENVDISDKKESVITLENLRRTVFTAYKNGGLTDFQFDFLDKRLVNYIKRIKDVKY